MLSITSGPTPQVASSAAHMSAQANKERKKRIERDSNSGLLTHKAVSLTIRPWEHEATGLTEHKHTYIHVLSYEGPIKMAAIPEGFALL